MRSHNKLFTEQCHPIKYNIKHAIINTTLCLKQVALLSQIGRAMLRVCQ